MSAGRPTSFKQEYTQQALKLTRLGATDKDLAGFFGVSVSAINRWKLQYPEFRESLKEGKLEADSQVAESLYRRALGYSHDAVKIFLDKLGKPIIVPYVQHYPPDVLACIFWLKNRQPGKWREKPVEADVTELPTGVKFQIISAPGMQIIDSEDDPKFSTDEALELTKINVGHDNEVC